MVEVQNRVPWKRSLSFHCNSDNVKIVFHMCLDMSECAIPFSLFITVLEIWGHDDKRGRGNFG